MQRRLITALLLLCWMAWLTMTLSAQSVQPDRSGVSPQVLSLPSGPGSIEGLGESFQPNLNTGMVNYQVKLTLPPAVNGHKPDIALIYNGGMGNGPLGVGWHVPVPYVQRQTDKGLPTYNDREDTFIYSNQEELVPLADGTFFCKNEGQFIRLRRAGASWEGTAKNGTRLVFGQSAPARITTPEGIFQWLLEQSIDPNGNVIQFTYQQDQGQAYLKEVRYNLFGDNFNSILFNYETRPDRFSDYRSRYKVTTAWRCAAIEIRARGAVQRRYVLEYTSDTTASLLRRATLYGRDGTTTLPPVTFTYTGFTANPTPTPMLNSPPGLSLSKNPNVEIFDADGDGLPDLLEGVQDNYRYYRNLGRGRWDRTRTDMGGSPGFDFGGRENTLGDYNSDAITGVVHKGKAFEYYPNTGADRFMRPIQFQNNPPFQFSDPSVRMIDLNFDKRPDVLRTTEDGQFFAWINPGNGSAWRGPIELGRPDPRRALLFSDPRVQLADMNGDRMLDLVWVDSGQVEYYPLKGYNRLGGMPQSIFDAKVVMQNAPQFTREFPLRLVDINGDGLADLVCVEPGRVLYWLNLGNHSFVPQRMVAGTPRLGGGFRIADMTGTGAAGVLWYDNESAPPRHVYLNFNNGPKPNLLIKVENGLGREIHFEYKNSTDYYMAAREANNPWCTKPPFVVPVLSRLRVKDLNSNQEYVTDFEYRDGYYNADQREFRGFEFVKTIERGDGTAPMLVALYKFEMGKAEESLKGKLLRVELLSEDFTMRCPRPDGSEVLPEPRQLFRREITRYTTRTLYMGTNGVPVKYSFTTFKSTFLFEKTDQAREVDEEFDQDAFGNVVRHVEYNDVTDGVIPGQQRITLTEYATDTAAYIVDKPSRIYVTDGDGNFVSEDLLYYDGPDYVGLARGQVTRGNLMRRSVRLGPQSTSGDRFIDVERKRYDSYGNVIGVMDSLGNAGNPTAGHARAISYDLAVHTYPIEERIYLEGGRSLVLTAEYDVGFGVVTAATDPAGQRTAFAYDALARLTAIAKPGDTLALPTERYTYTLANPVSNVRAEKRVQSGQPPVIVTVQYVDGLGRQLQTKEPAGPNRFVTREAVAFNLRSTIKEKYLPYFTGTLSYEPPDVSKPKTQMVYDSLGREVRLVQPVGGFIQTVYQPLRRVVSDEENTNPSSPHANKPRTLAFDGFGRLLGIEERNGTETYVTAYGYDLLNNLVYVRDALGNESVRSYDGAKRLVYSFDPDRGPRLLTYDDAGNILESADGNGQILRNSYDAANRLKTQVFVVGGEVTPHTTYHYDNDLPFDHPELANTMGRLTYVEDLTGRSMFSFDARGNTVTRIRDVSGLGEFATRFTYDALERMASITYPDGMRVMQTYDPYRGLLASVPGYVPEIEYTAAAQLARLRLQNGAETRYGYDDRLRLVSLRTISPSATPNAVQDLGYTFDGVSNMVRIVDGRPGIGDAHNATEDFTYDNLYRLTQTRGRYGVINLAYDAINNLIRKTSTVDHPELNIGTLTYGMGAGPHQVVQAGGRTYAYDGNGNMLTRSGLTQVWDPKDRLIATIRDDGDQTYYTYDFADRRVIKAHGDDVVIYINKYAEIRNGRPIKYVFAGKRRVAQVDDQGIMYYHPDHLGSTNIVTNAAGAVVERSQYYAFGTERTRDGSSRANYRYIDRELDDSTGLYYLGARYYHHGFGMFLSGDPADFDQMNPQSINPYHYGLHSPYRYVDPDGLYYNCSVEGGCLLAAPEWGGWAHSWVGGTFGGDWIFDASKSRVPDFMPFDDEGQLKPDFRDLHGLRLHEPFADPNNQSDPLEQNPNEIQPPPRALPPPKFVIELPRYPIALPGTRPVPPTEERPWWFCSDCEQPDNSLRGSKPYRDLINDPLGPVVRDSHRVFNIFFGGGGGHAFFGGSSWRF